ncbi:hypothetical protein [Actinophytocola gossypii]|uniref:Uncharacterized protein n=1 Tax=Actinophytocola gossypii TaxID=2812003 RepID=A0ABT2JG98_9PSEU|nr:hypothetical protein [Actinophytocola gossypii]MCT2586895.1 hypothetical protein [Actinophytocola gossypii]
MRLSLAVTVGMLTVGNPARGSVGTGRGLAGLGERLRLLGSMLDVDTGAGRFTLVARVPLS